MKKRMAMDLNKMIENKNSNMNIQNYCDNKCEVKKDAEMMAGEISRYIIVVRFKNGTMHQCRFCDSTCDDYMELKHEPDCIVNIANKYIGE